MNSIVVTLCSAEIGRENRRLLERQGLAEYFSALDLFEMQAAYVMETSGNTFSFLKVRALYERLAKSGYLKSQVECAMAFCAAEGAEIEDIDVFMIVLKAMPRPW